MAKVPLRTGLLADVTNSDSDHAAMKTLAKSSLLPHEKSSAFSPDDNATFSPRTDLANKLLQTSLSCDDQAESDLSNSPPLCTPNRRPGCTESKNRRNVVAANIGRMSPLVIADEQTKFPELEDSISQKSIDAAWGRRRSCTFSEMSTDSGFGSSSMQSWADSQRSGASSSFSPSIARQLAVINESSNFAFSPSAFSSLSQEASRDSFVTDSPCPSTPQHRIIALRSRSRGTPKHCSPSPSLPKHIQALVRGGVTKPHESFSATTSPTAVGIAKKPLGKQSFFSTAVANEQQSGSTGRLIRANSLKRVASTDGMDIFSSQQPASSSQSRSLPFSPLEAKKMKSQLESIKEGAIISTNHRCSLSHSQSSTILTATPLQLPPPPPTSKSTSSQGEEAQPTSESAVTVTTTSPESTCQAPPDTCMVGDGSRPYLLPCKPHESTVLIECSELADLLAGKYSTQVKDFHIIDCRYPYEHAGGHIRGAVNHPKADPLLHDFFKDSNNKQSAPTDENGQPKRTLLIFHCEFSSQRAPAMVKAFRKRDRDRNRNSYPRLDYPEVYMLQGGYKAFYEYCCATSKLELLEPLGGYTPMHAEEHNHELRKWKKYKTMSAVEERLVKTGQSVSPLSASCAANNNDASSLISLSQQDSNSFLVADENKHFRLARRPLVRRQLSSFSVPHNSNSTTSPLVQRSDNTKLVDKATPLNSHMLNAEQLQEDSENRPPPMDSPSDW